VSLFSRSNRRDPNRFVTPAALIAAALLHLAVFIYFRPQISGLVSLVLPHDETVNFYLPSQKPRHGSPKKEPEQTPQKPEPESQPEAPKFLLTANAPAELPAAAPSKGEPQKAEGGGVPEAVSEIGSLDNMDFAPLYNPSPAYPEIARAAGMEGFVLVELLIDENGMVVEFKILQVSGHPQFGKETEKVISRWKFPPPRQNGKPVRVKYVYKILFRLG